MGKPAAGVRVRGTCKAGHQTEATSDPGRVTWNGQCATDGCELPVRAVRIPADTPAPDPGAQVADDAGAAGDDPHRVREVSSYGDEPNKPEQPDSPAGGDGDQPARPPAGGSDTGGAGGGPTAPAPPTTPAPVKPGKPRGLFGRARAALGERPPPEPERDFGFW